MTAVQMKKVSAKIRRRRWARRMMLLAVLLAMGFILAERNFRPLVLSLAEAKSAQLATQVLSGAVAQALESGAAYDDLMNVRMDANGQVALLSANTMRMNQLADKAGKAAQRMLQSMSSEQVSVPLGAALGLTIFAGSGPDIPVSIVPIGSITTDFATEFEACGINQTRHKVYMRVTAWIRVVIPTQAKEVEVSNNVLLAESIIIGDSLTSDIRGGLNAGIKTCLFNPAGKTGREDIVPDFEIRALSELPGLLERL